MWPVTRGPQSALARMGGCVPVATSAGVVIWRGAATKSYRSDPLKQERKVTNINSYRYSNSVCLRFPPASGSSLTLCTLCDVYRCVLYLHCTNSTNQYWCPDPRLLQVSPSSEFSAISRTLRRHLERLRVRRRDFEDAAKCYDVHMHASKSRRLTSAFANGRGCDNSGAG